MTAFVDLPYPPRIRQRLLAGALRGTLRLLFRGLIRPWMPIAGQRTVLRLLTAATLPMRGVLRSAGQLGGIPCEWHRPQQDSGRVCLYLHGGGYLLGSPATHRALCSALSKRCRMAVCAIDYRLAPEHRYPAPLIDVLEAYQALLEQGYAPQNIVIGGDSAGGHLTLTSALALKAQGLPLPGALVCFSPVTDLSIEQLHQPPAGDPMIDLGWIRQALDLASQPGVDSKDPSVSPVFADLTGLPPLLVQVGEDEVLRNDSLRLAERAQACGVPVRLERYAGCWHVFQAHVGVLDVADLAIQRVADFLETADRHAR